MDDPQNLLLCLSRLVGLVVRVEFRIVGHENPGCPNRLGNRTLLLSAYGLLLELRLNLVPHLLQRLRLSLVEQFRHVVHRVRRPHVGISKHLRDDIQIATVNEFLRERLWLTIRLGSPGNNLSVTLSANLDTSLTHRKRGFEGLDFLRKLSVLPLEPTSHPNLGPENFLCVLLIPESTLQDLELSSR